MNQKTELTHFTFTQGWVQDLTRVALIALVYFAAHWIAFLYPDAEQILAAIWPAGGIGLAALLLSRRRLWGPILVGMFLAGNIANLMAGRPLFNSLGFMTANVLESLTCAWLITFFCGENIRFTRGKEVLALFFAAVFVNAGTALIGAGTASLAFHALFGNFWATWWIADGLGILIVTPLIVAWMAPKQNPQRLHWVSIFEPVLFLSLIIMVTWLLFRDENLIRPQLIQPYMLFVLLAYAAFRFSMRGVTSATVILSVILISSKSVITGPLIWGGNTLEERLWLAQLFIASAAITNYLLNASVMERQQAEKTVRENQVMLTTILNSIPQAIFWKDRSGQYLGCNDNFSRSIGLNTPKEVIGKTDFQLPISQAEAIAFQLEDQEVIDQNQPKRHILNSSHAPNGALVWSDTTKLPLVDMYGYPIGILGVFDDITERKQLESDLKEKSDFLEQVFNHLGQGLTVSGPDGCLEFVNPAYADFVGRLPQELIGKSPEEMTYPEDRHVVKQAWAVRLQGVASSYETRLMHRNGSLVPVLISGVPRIKDDKLIGSIAVITDLRQLKAAEEKLYESEEKYRSFVSQSAEALMLTDETGILIEWNPAAEKFTGIPAAEALGSYTWDIQQRILPLEMRTPQQLENSRQNMLQILQSGDGPFVGKYFEIRMKLPDGNLRLLRQLFFAIKTPIGYRAGSITHDVTEEKLAEARLAESEEELRAIIEASPDAIGLFDANANILFMNPAAAVTFGYETSADMIGKNALEFYLPDEQEKAIGAIQQILVQGSVKNAEFRLLRKDGSSFEAEFSCSAMYEPDGKPKGIVAITRDVTERKRAEAALHFAETEYRNIFNRAPVGIFQSTPQGRFSRVNSFMADMYGYDSPEAMIESITDIGSQLYENSLDRKKFQQSLAENGEILNFIGRNCRKDRSIIWTQTSARAIKNSDGNIIFYEGFLHDITERIKVEENLRASERQYHAMFDTNTAIKLLIDPSTGAIIQANTAAASFYKCSIDQLDTMNMNQINTLSNEEILAEMKVAASQERTYFNFRHRLATGEIRDVEVHSSPIEIGGQILLFSIIHDISARKEAEAALLAAHAELEQRVMERTAELHKANQSLEKALSVRDEFMAAMSHELRTPLTGVLGLSQVLQMHTYGTLNEKQLNAVVNIEKSGQRLLNVINNVIDYSLLQSGSMIANLKPCSLEYICQTAIRAISPVASQKNQQIHFNMPPEQITINTDERRFNQVLSHLLHNASKFTPTGGEFGIEVRGELELKIVALTVWDTGIGIKPEDQHRLFHPFIQIDASLTRKFEGTGLGLALVKQISELLGGSVTVESEFGKGSRFTVTLPWNR